MTDAPLGQGRYGSEARFGQLAGRLHNALPPDPEHVRNELLRHLEFIGAQSVQT